MFGWIDYLAPGMVAHAVLALSVIAALGLVLEAWDFEEFDWEQPACCSPDFCLGRQASISTKIFSSSFAILVLSSLSTPLASKSGQASSLP